MSLGYGFSLPECVATNDHYWHGGSICTACGERLRCECGQFVRADSIDEHMDSCAVIAKLVATADAEMGTSPQC